MKKNTETNVEKNILSTEELLNLIQNSPKSFESMVENNQILDKEPGFCETLNGLLEKHNVTTQQVIVETVLSKSYVYQVLSGERKPGRDIIIKIAIAATLSLDETQHLLMLGEKGILYPKVKRDAIIMSSILRERNVAETHDFLISLGEKGLL